MADPGIVVGRVSIKVWPDLEPFEDGLRRAVKTAEKKHQVDVPVTGDTSTLDNDVRRGVRRANRRADKVEIEVALDYDGIGQAIDRVDGMLRSLEAAKIEVEYDHDALSEFRAQLEDMREVSTIPLEIIEDEAGLTAARNRIAQALREKQAYSIDVEVDEESLRTMLETLDEEIAQHKVPDVLTLDVRADRDALKANIARVNDALAQIRTPPVKVDLDEGSLEQARRELERMLAEKPYEIEVTNDEAGAREALRQVDRLIAEHDMKKWVVQNDPEALKKMRHELQEIVDDYDDKKLAMEVEAHSLKAKAELARVARERRVELFVTVNKAAAAKAAAAIAALSGSRLVHSTLENIWDLFKNLDKNIPLVGTIALAIQGLSAWLLAAASNSFALARGLAQIAGAGLALPGIVGGMALGVGATVAVLKDFNAVIPTVSQRMSELQDAMSADFWSIAKAPMEDAINRLFPQFETGMRQASVALGLWFAEFSYQAKRHLDGSLDAMFANLQDSIAIATGSLDEAANIIEILGRRGAEYLPRLAGWFADITENFSEWLTAADESGRLNEIIEVGIYQLRAFGRVVAETGGILAGLARAAERAGGSTLDDLADKLETIHNKIDTPGFQNRLTQALLAAHDAMDRISNVSGPRVSAFFDNMVDLLTETLPDVGDSIGMLIGGITEALSTDRFSTGFVRFFDGLRSALETLNPMWGPLGDGLGAVLDLAGTFAETFAPLLASLLTTVSELAQRITPNIERMAEALSERLLMALQVFGPIIVRAADALALLIEPLVRIPGLVELAAAAFAAFKVASFIGGARKAWAEMLTLTAASGPLGAKLAALGSAASGSVGKLGGLTGALGRLGLKLAPLLGPAGLVVGLGAAITAWDIGVVTPDVQELTRAIEGLSLSVGEANLNELFQGEASGWSWLHGSILGDDMNNLATDVQSLGDAFRYTQQWADASVWDKIWNYGDAFGGFGAHSDALNQSKEALQAFDEAAAAIVRSGDVEKIGDLARYVATEQANAGLTTAQVAEKLPQYSQALEVASAESARAAAQAEAAAARNARAVASYERAVSNLGGITPTLIGTINEGSKAFFDLGAQIGRTTDDVLLSNSQWISSLEDQVAEQAEWADNMAELAERGVSEGVLSELARLGPEGAERVAALTEASDEELERLNKVFETGMQGAVAASTGAFAELAREAVAEMGGMPDDARAALEEMPDVFWTLGWDAVQDYIDGFEEGNSGSDATDAGEDVGEDIARGISEGMAMQIPDLSDGATDMADEIIRATSDRMQIRSPSRVMMSIGGFVAQGLINGMRAMFGPVALAGEGLAGAVLSVFAGAGSWLVETGGALIGGLLEGMSFRLGQTDLSKVAGRVAKGITSSEALYSAGRSLASNLREGLYSYNNDGTGRRVGNTIASGMRDGDAYSAGRSLAYSLRRGLYSYNNAGSGAHIGRIAANATSVSAFSSGQAVASSFADGLSSRWSKARVGKAALSLVREADKYFPQSPAEKGPFSGKGWVDNSGMAIGDALADGMLARVPKVRMAALAMANAASAVNEFGVNGLDAAISTDNHHTVSLADSDVTLMVDGRPMRAYIREGVDEGIRREGRDLEYAN